MPWADTHADLYRERDIEALNGHTAKNRIETQLQASGKLTKVIVNKVPLHDSGGKIIGIIGSFIEMPDDFDASFKSKISLPRVQKEVMCAVANGLSAKQIAAKMNLSRRTIEFYIDILKHKFACRTKSELIARLWKLSLMPSI